MRVVAVMRLGRTVEVAASMRRVAARCTVVGRHIAGWRPLSPIGRRWPDGPRWRRRLVSVTSVAVAVGVLSSCASGGAGSTLDGLKKDPMGAYAPVGFELMSELEGDRKESGLFTGKPVQAMWIRDFSPTSTELNSDEVVDLIAEEAAAAGWEITTQDAYGLGGRKVIEKQTGVHQCLGDRAGPVLPLARAHGDGVDLEVRADPGVGGLQHPDSARQLTGHH
jgi:hypothetical protein